MSQKELFHFQQQERTPRIHTVSLDQQRRVSWREIFQEKRERTLRFLDDKVKKSNAVVIEGPPIYLYPVLPDMHWDHPSFIGGWDFVNDFYKRIPETKGFQYVLIDDLNYRQKGVFDAEERLKILRESHDVLRNSAVSHPKSQRIKYIFESELAVVNESNVCSVLDAAYNKKKIVDRLDGFGGTSWLYPGNIEKLSLVVVTPDSRHARSEQLQMFQSLYEQLRKHPAYKTFSKEITRKAVTATFNHVWLNQEGNISGVTVPVFENNKFSFKQVFS